MGKSQFLQMENLKEVSCEFQIVPQFTLASRKRETRSDKFETFQISNKTGVLHKSEKIVLEVCFEPHEERRYEQVFVISLRESCKKIEVKCTGRGYFPRLEFCPREISFYNSLPCKENYRKLEIKNFGVFDSKLVLADKDDKLLNECETISRVAQVTPGDFRSPQYLRFGVKRRDRDKESQAKDMGSEDADEFNLPQSVDKVMARQEELNRIRERHAHIQNESDSTEVKRFIMDVIKHRAGEINQEQNRLFRIKLRQEMTEKKTIDLEEPVEPKPEENSGYKWSANDDVTETEDKLVVIVIGESASKTAHVVEVLGTVQNRMVLDLADLIEWNVQNGFEIGITILEAMEDFKGGKWGELTGRTRKKHAQKKER